MNKTLIALCLISTFTLTACTTPKTDTAEDVTTPTDTTNTTETNDTNLITNENTSMDCKILIEEYLDQAITEKNEGENIKNWDTIVVHYIGRLDAKEVFDTSHENIAKACGKHNTQRDYDAGLEFTVGGGQMIAWFDKAVVDMKTWETKTIIIEAKDAYGERSETKLVKVNRNDIPDADQYKKGGKVMTQMWQIFTVYEIDDTEVTLDTNHELAGKELIFDITIKEIK